MRHLPALLFIGLGCGCVAQHADHFYALAPVPSQGHESRHAFARQVQLVVTIPALVDRNEMVVTSATGIDVLEHERWAAPLTEQIATVLGQDIEQRRPDSLVASRSLARQTLPTVNVAVELVSLTIEKNARATLEVRWRVQRDPSEVTQGRDTFEAPLRGAAYEGVAPALSACVAALADRLVQEWPSGG